MQTLKEWIGREQTEDQVDEAVRASECHVHFDDAKQEFLKNDSKIFQEILKDAVSEKRFHMMLMDTLYNILNAKKLPYGDKMQDIVKHINDDGYIDKMYAVEYFKLALSSVLFQMGTMLQNKKPLDFNFPDKIAKAVLMKCCPSCKEK